VKRTRGLWASIIVVGLLVGASLIGFATGALAPKLGLDLQGGVSVILQAPPDTGQDVMNQALENIRNRVDAFGVGEPQIAVSGTTIDVQIPGGANGTVEQRAKTQYCLVTSDQTSYGCAPDQATAEAALAELKVVSVPSQVCLNDPGGKQLACYASQSEADTAKASITVAPKTVPSPSASPATSPSSPPAPAAGGSCLVDSTGTELACYPTKKAAEDAQKGITSDVALSKYCVTAPAAAAPSPSPSASPSGAGATASPSEASSASATGSASPSAAPSSSAFSKLDREGAPDLPCGLSSKASADAALAGISASKEDTEFCVVSAAGDDLGCYISQNDAQTKQRETGQDRLLAVIGKTARLEQRQVMAAIVQGDPAFATTQLTCPTAAEQLTPKCSADALSNQEVVYADQGGTTRYRLGPVVINGNDVTKASAVLSGGTQTQVVQQWVVNFDLSKEGSKAFSDLTTKLAALPASDPQKRIAIVVDRQVISAPAVQSPITGGSGQITGGFTEQQAKDLATVLNAGALPVDLNVQSVTTISPTLGSESLHQGIVAGLLGLMLLFAYMLFYYRLLGIVAILGMSIWAVLAFALVAVAGDAFGYSMTLAGVAGLVISLGVTADSYIVFFERLKDEVRSGKSARSSVQPAFKRAFRTILAADIVTGIAAAVLYMTAVSSVRGFALTLGVATLLDLFVVYFFKRPVVFLVARNDRLVNMRGFGLTSGIAGDAEPEDALPAGGQA
jgi:preprotein translocase subunit SecD